MNPLVLIHGYSAEHGSRADSRTDITRIYGSLPAALRRRYGADRVLELNVARYLSLDDGINLDDLAQAMDNALAANLPGRQRFDALVHSTGALVVRNWLRRHSARPSRLQRLIYLAGANFGSGWAHIGRGQLAKWGRAVFQGAETGAQLLDALELGADETLELHRHFLDADNSLWSRFRVREFCICGSQAAADWLPIPVRYAREDGADGVVRVASGNAGWNYIAIGPKRRALALQWDEVRGSCALLGSAPGDREEENNPGEYYRVSRQQLADEQAHPPVPLAIPYQCAHSGSERGIVTGRRTRRELLELLDAGLAASSDAQYRRVAENYAARSQRNLERAARELEPGPVAGIFNEPRAQYDAHAQLIFRLRDQHGRPVEHADVLLNSPPDARLAANELFEHVHRNRRSPHILCFYLRTARFDSTRSAWVDRVAEVGGLQLEIAPTATGSGEIRYLPVCLSLSAQRLRRFLQNHRTTMVDVTLLRLPSPGVFRLTAATGA